MSEPKTNYAADDQISANNCPTCGHFPTQYISSDAGTVHVALRSGTLSQEQIARVAHEVNRAYCQALGDDSQPAWEEAPEWQRASARMGVDLHTMGNFGPEASHISWMKQKVADGWVFGPVKDPEAKTHPCLVPFADLPREQQAKDYLFRGVVHALRETTPVDVAETQTC
jgi:hypothetical protein